MATVSDLIHSSFRLIGAIAAGETLETVELNDALVSLNQMIALWNTEGTSVVSRQSFRITVGSSSNSYPLTFQPIRIESASVNYANLIDVPLEIVDSVGWEATPEKAAQTVYVKKLYCDYQYPTSTVYIAPLPRMGGTLEFWYVVLMQPFTDINQMVNMPMGYEQAVRYNFAVALLPEYPRAQADPSLPAQAQMYKASIAQLNATNHLRSQSQSPAQAAVSDAAETAAR